MHPSKRILFLISALSLCAAPAVAESDNLGLRSSQAESVPASGVLASPETESIDWSALNWDPSRLSGSSANITAKKSLPSAWQSKVGVDANKANQPGSVGAPINPDSLLPGATPRSASDAAWANVTAPGIDTPVGWDKTTFDARFDPAHDERKLGTTLSKSVPLNERFSVTLQNGYSMTQTPSAAQAASATPHGHDSWSQNYSTDNAAKLNVLSTGTSLSVGTTMSTTDEKWRRSLGAEQNLFGGISVKGSVTESADRRRRAGPEPDGRLQAQLVVTPERVAKSILNPPPRPRDE